MLHETLGEQADRPTVEVPHTRYRDWDQKWKEVKQRGRFSGKINIAGVLKMHQGSIRRGGKSRHMTTPASSRLQNYG